MTYAKKWSPMDLFPPILAPLGYILHFLPHAIILTAAAILVVGWHAGSSSPNWNKASYKTKLQMLEDENSLNYQLKKHSALIPYDAIDSTLPSNSTNPGWLIEHSKIPNDVTPILCFVNTASGGQQGLYVMSQLIKYLNHHQVFDLKLISPELVLEKYSKLPSGFKVVACGGDGTVGWILNSIQKLNLNSSQVSVAILPLGTGNDLALELGWGTVFECSSISAYLDEVILARKIPIDRWELTIEEGAPTAPTSTSKILSTRNPAAATATAATTAGTAFTAGIDGDDAEEDEDDDGEDDDDNDDNDADGPKGGVDKSATAGDVPATQSSATSEHNTKDINSTTAAPYRAVRGSKRAFAGKLFKSGVSHVSKVAKKLSSSSQKIAPSHRRLWFQNYMGIGVDAQISNRFHETRKASPYIFIHNLVNKLIYGVMGCNEMWGQSCVDFPQHVRLYCDGVEIPLPYDTQGIVFVNIASYGGGSRLWYDDDDDESAIPTEGNSRSGSFNGVQSRHGLGPDDCSATSRMSASESFRARCNSDPLLYSDSESSADTDTDAADPAAGWRPPQQLHLIL